MALFDPADRGLVEAVSQLVYCNPFLPERIEFEQAALGFTDFYDMINFNLGHPHSLGEVLRSQLGVLLRDDAWRRSARPPLGDDGGVRPLAVDPRSSFLRRA